jgi:hypothetical protein
MYGDEIKIEDLDLEEFISGFGHLLKDGYASAYAPDGSEEPPEASALASLEAFRAWHGSYAEEDVQALLRLKDGRWATVMASCDSSGYDCIGYVDWYYADTFEQAILFGLDQGARDNLFPKDFKIND